MRHPSPIRLRPGHSPGPCYTRTPTRTNHSAGRRTTRNEPRRPEPHDTTTDAAENRRTRCPTPRETARPPTPRETARPPTPRETARPPTPRRTARPPTPQETAR